MRDRDRGAKIANRKQRGEWAELKFMTAAAEHGLWVSKPWGDSASYDVVVGRPGHFVAVQVKCTIARTENRVGYVCSTCSSHKKYRRGSFDFLAAYVVHEDAWYIIPEKEIRGNWAISLLTQCKEARYEEYREAWHLLREPAFAGDIQACAEEFPVSFGDRSWSELGGACRLFTTETQSHGRGLAI